jgi:hypothetical protein
MNENQRWNLALHAHAEEHAAMRERGLSRAHVIGRPYGMKGVKFPLDALQPGSLGHYAGDGQQYALQRNRQGTDLPNLDRLHNRVVQTSRRMQQASLGALEPRTVQYIAMGALGLGVLGALWYVAAS